MADKEVEVTAGTIGWIKLYRSVMETDVWQDKPFARGQAWVDLIMLAGHKDKEFWFNATCLTLKRGQFITSKRKLGERWGWSNSKVDKFLRELQKVEMISVESDHRKTIINIVNYDKYQSSDSEASQKRQSSDSEASQKRQSSDSEASQKRTIKNNKNNKNIRSEEEKEEPAALSSLPDDEEIEWLDADELEARLNEDKSNGTV